MPLGKKWSHFLKVNVAKTTDKYGVYELGNTNGEVHYIGEGQIKSRLLSHFVRGGEAIPGTKYYRYEYTGGKKAAVQRQNALLKVYDRIHGKLPKFNQKSKA